MIAMEYFSDPHTAKIYIEHSRSPYNMGHSHHHDFYEVYYYLGDEMRYFIEDKAYTVKKYDMLFCDRYIFHKSLYSDKDSKDRVLILLQPGVWELLGDTQIKAKILELFKIRKVSFPDHINQVLLHTLQDRILPTYYGSNALTSSIRSVFLTLDFLLEILEFYEKGLLIIDETELQPQEKKIAAVIQYINLNYSDKISLDDISKKCFVSKYYLCHIFKNVTGTSIVNFIHNKRLTEAEKLLRYSTSNITKISETVGFNNVNQFICLFKSKFGCTPGEFKKLENLHQ